jgi:hypothetical protein
MFEIIGAAVLLLLVLASIAWLWLFKSRHNKLDKTYHEALHAESIGDYDKATSIYQSMLQNSHRVQKDEKLRIQIQQRMDTIRYQKQYDNQFAEDADAARVKSTAGVNHPPPKSFV